MQSPARTVPVQLYHQTEENTNGRVHQTRSKKLLNRGSRNHGEKITIMKIQLQCTNNDAWLLKPVHLSTRFIRLNSEIACHLYSSSGGGGSRYDGERCCVCRYDTSIRARPQPPPARLGQHHG